MGDQHVYRVLPQVQFVERQIVQLLEVVLDGVDDLLVRALARRVKQSSNGDALRREVIVDGAGLLRLGNVHRHIPVLQQGQRFPAGVQSQQHAAAQDNHLAAMVDQLGDVRRLDTGCMVGAGFTPVPGTAAARPQLEILSGTDAVDGHAAPGQCSDSG